MGITNYLSIRYPIFHLSLPINLLTCLHRTRSSAADSLAHDIGVQQWSRSAIHE